MSVLLVLFNSQGLPLLRLQNVAKGGMPITRHRRSVTGAFAPTAIEQM
jgi:hypothetical protein